MKLIFILSLLAAATLVSADVPIPSEPRLDLDPDIAPDTFIGEFC